VQPKLTEIEICFPAFMQLLVLEMGANTGNGNAISSVLVYIVRLGTCNIGISTYKTDKSKRGH